ncbi:MAG: hypothetical protein B7Z02_07055 [Rhodobacterales bacterium 32-67-9]|nr:MAG: hypothetical protein B7Z02_07055 [Rhodobacterales bacterium 32-67-9]
MLIRRYLGALAFALLAGPLLADAPLKRLTLRQDLLGWEAVGRVEIGRGGYCTGVLIAPDLVLTAAHCLFGGGTYANVADLRFRAGLRDGVALAESDVLKALAHPAYDPRGRDRAKQIRWDVGLLQLANPVPVTTAAPFPTATLSDGARGLSVVSYGQGRDDALSWDERCGVLGRSGGLIAFDCDVTFGSSGAPVFHRTGGRAALVSLVSAGVAEGGDRVAFGMELPQAVAELKAALRRGDGDRLPPPAPEGQAGARTIRPSVGFGTKASGGAKFLTP